MAFKKGGDDILPQCEKNVQNTNKILREVLHLI